MITNRTHQSFICIGPRKTGTTWFYEKLNQHPQVFLPPYKELRFFYEKAFLDENHLVRVLRILREFLPKTPRWPYYRYKDYIVEQLDFYVKNFSNRDKNYVNQLLWYLKYLFLPHSDRWYSSLFDRASGRISGAITPVYYMLPESEVARISQAFPNLKVIIFLRNAIDRVWSYTRQHLCKHQKIKVEKSVASIFYSQFDGLYHKCPSYVSLIAQWEKYFPKNNIHVNFYDRLVEHSWSFFEEICSFIGVDPDLMPDSARQKIPE